MLKFSRVVVQKNMGYVIKAQNDWGHGQPQVPVHRQLPPLL